jgi:hypothetical protein
MPVMSATALRSAPDPRFAIACRPSWRNRALGGED